MKEILKEKREVEKSNMDLEYKTHGRGITEAEQKNRLFEAQRKLEMELSHNHEIMSEDIEMKEKLLKEEEKKCKVKLDEKIDAEQE